MSFLYERMNTEYVEPLNLQVSNQKVAYSTDFALIWCERILKMVMRI
jgi:hypothetical protein